MPTLLPVSTQTFEIVRFPVILMWKKVSLRPSLIFITESWLTENDTLSEYTLEGYQQLESKPRKNGTRGGVAFYARYGVNYQIIDYSSELECLRIEATFDEANIKNFCVVYRPDGVKFTVFLDLFESLLLFLKTLKHDCTLFGDFNIDTVTDDNEKRKYVNLLAAYENEIQNSSPTRVTTTSSTCLDHVISGFPIEIKTVKVTISDLYALQSEIPILLNDKKGEEPMLLRRDLRNIKGPKALNFLFLLDQKLKSVDKTTDPEKYLSEIVICIVLC